MQKKIFARLCVLSLAAAVAACGDSANKIGSTVKGTRIAVMEQAKALTPDAGVKNSKPALPRMIVNLSWPQAGYDSEHDLPYAEAPAHPHVEWKENVGEGSDSDFKLLTRPVIDNGAVYTMDSQGLVRAFDAKEGRQLWECDTTPKDSDEKTIAGGIAVDGNSLYATTGFGDVYALDTKSGEVRWVRSLQKPLRAPPTVADNKVFTVSIDNQLSAIDAKSGTVLWQQAGIAESAALMGASSPAVQDDNVVVAYNSGEIYNLRVQNGRVSWNYSLTTPTQVGALPAIADIRGLPVLDHGKVFAISHSGRMAAIEQRSGDRVWEADIGGIDTPVVAGDTVFVYGGDGQLIALSRDNGQVMWVSALPKLADPSDKDSDKVVWAGPILAGERLWMVNSAGKLASFSPNDGSAIDSIDLGEPIYLAPVVADRTIYVVTDEGTLIALR